MKDEKILKKIKVKSLASECLEINGTAKEQRNKLRDLCYVYCKPFSESTVSNCFWFNSEGFEIKRGSSLLCIGDEVFSPKSLSDFVSIALAAGIEIYWDNDTYTEFIDRRILRG